MDTLQIQHVVHWGSNPSEDKAKPTVTNDPWRKSTTGEPLQRTRTEHSGRVQQQVKFKTTSTSSSRQLQPSSKNMQQTNMLCYDPQLQGYFIWHCHLSHDPLAATSLDHRCTLVQDNTKMFKTLTKTFKTIPKQSSENCWQVELQNVATKLRDSCKGAQWVHICPTECKWHQTSY